MDPSAPEATAQSRDGRTFVFTARGSSTFRPGDVVVAPASDDVVVLGQVLGTGDPDDGVGAEPGAESRTLGHGVVLGRSAATAGCSGRTARRSALPR